jgi:hypothetical protein
VSVGYVAFLSLRVYSLVFPLTKVWGLFLQGLCAGLTGIVILVLVLKLLNNRELEDVVTTLHKKIWKTPVPPAEVEHM